MAEIAEVSHEDMHNALEESGVKPLVSSTPIKHDTQYGAKMAIEKEYDMQRSPSKGAILLPSVDLDNRGPFGSQHILSSG